MTLEEYVAFMSEIRN